VTLSRTQIRFKTCCSHWQSACCRKAGSRLAHMRQVGKMHDYLHSKSGTTALHSLPVATTAVAMAFSSSYVCRSVFINKPFVDASSLYHVMATVTLHTRSTALKKLNTKLRFSSSQLTDRSDCKSSNLYISTLNVSLYRRLL
jgi:hypothetical protein